MARTKQTARVTRKEGDSNQAHTLQREIAMATTSTASRYRALQRSRSLSRAREARSMDQQQRMLEQEEEHVQQRNEQQEQQGQQEQQEEHQQQQEQQEEHQEEQDSSHPERQREHAGSKDQPEQQGTQYDPRIFRDLDPIFTGNPLVAQRTPLPDFFPPRNVAEEQQQQWVLQEQARLFAYEEERARQQRVAEEENRTAAEQIQRELDSQRTPIKLRKKQPARKNTPKRLVPTQKRAQPEQQEQARQDEAEGAGQHEAEGIRGDENLRREEVRKKFRHDPPAWERRAPPPPPPTVKRKYKFKPGTVALREIRKYQRSTELLIPRAPFTRIVREVMADYSDRVERIQGAALGALQEAAETVLVMLFQDSVLCHVHAKRVTLKPVDMGLAMRLRTDDCLRKS